MSFWNLNSKEYETLAKKILDLKILLEELQGTLKIMRTDVDNLRGTFNRKLTGIKKEEKAESKPTEQIFLNPDGQPLS